MVNKPMPQVSVIIPNYNHARFLTQRVRSVLEQTFQDFEIIIIDDASTDESKEVIATFTHLPQVRAVFGGQNSGCPFVQWNKGVKLAQGEFVWIAESDDFAEPQLLESLSAALERHPAAGLAYCRSVPVDENGQRLERAGEDLRGQHRFANDYVNNGRHECRRYLLFQNYLPNASAVLFRRELFESIGGADETCRIAGDWKTWMELLLTSDVAYVARELSFFRFHGDTVRRQSDAQGLRVCESFRITSDIADKLEVEAELRQRVLNTQADNWIKNTWAGQIEFSRQCQKSILQTVVRIDPGIKGRLVRRFLVLACANIAQRVRRIFRM